LKQKLLGMAEKNPDCAGPRARRKAFVERAEGARPPNKIGLCGQALRNTLELRSQDLLAKPFRISNLGHTRAADTQNDLFLRPKSSKSEAQVFEVFEALCPSNGGLTKQLAMKKRIGQKALRASTAPCQLQLHVASTAPCHVPHAPTQNAKRFISV